MIRSIQMRFGMKGKGIVNFDTHRQKYMLKNSGVDGIDVKYDNYTLGKHHYYPLNGDKDESRKWITHRSALSISADCLRHYIYIDGFPYQNPNVCHSQALINMVTGSIDGQTRGYLLTEAQGKTLKRSSCLLITDAEQVAGGASIIEISTTSGAKEQRESTDDNSGTSMHYKETIGEVSYAFEGAIDLKDLQFISCSELYDRLAINPDQANQVRALLGAQLGSEIQPVKWYTIKGSVVKLPEQGIMLTKEQMATTVSYLLNKIVNLNIRKTRAYARLETMEIRFIENPLTDFNKPWTTVLNKYGDVTMPALDPASFEVFYEEMTEEEAKALYGEVDTGKTAAKAKARDKNEKVRERKEAAKAGKSKKGD